MEDLIGLTTEEIATEVARVSGEPAYRGRQVAEWIYRRLVERGEGALTFGSMTDLPIALRDALAAEFSLAPLTQSSVVKDSHDGTVKLVVALPDGPHVEAVLMPDVKRVSVCLSSQAGCPMGCVFCATGTQGLARNLTAAEIVAQFMLLQAHSQRRITHIVFMGMGEPMLNYDNVLRAINILSREVGVSMRHITLSTVGIIPAIKRLADESLALTLAVSLHAANETLRTRIVPVNKNFTIAKLMDACKEYFAKTSRRVTFEYILLREVNDRPSDARELAALLRGFPCAVNIIPYNATSVAEPFQRPEVERIAAFRTILENAGIVVTQRKERGQQIAAACGQLVTEIYRPSASAMPLAVSVATSEGV